MKNYRYALLIMLIAVTVLCTMLFALGVAAADEVSYAAGDVNADGVIDTKDLIVLRQYFANYDYDLNVAGKELSGNADMNDDGKISSADLGALRNYIANNENPGEDIPDESEPVQDNVFDAVDLLAAYDYNCPDGFQGELIVENGVAFFRATATAAKEGTLVLNTGKNTVEGVGKSFVVVYRNKTADINRIQLGINSSGKTDNAGGATPFYAISKTSEWKAIYFSTSNAVDLTNGAGYMSIDIFDTDNS